MIKAFLIISLIFCISPNDSFSMKRKTKIMTKKGKWKAVPGNFKVKRPGQKQEPDVSIPGNERGQALNRSCSDPHSHAGCSKVNGQPVSVNAISGRDTCGSTTRRVNCRHAPGTFLAIDNVNYRDDCCNR